MDSARVVVILDRVRIYADVELILYHIPAHITPASRPEKQICSSCRLFLCAREGHCKRFCSFPLQSKNCKGEIESPSSAGKEMTDAELTLNVENVFVTKANSKTD